MTAILLTVTDLELIAAQAVKIILLALIVFGAGFNGFKAFKAAAFKKKLLRGVISIALFLLSIPVIWWIQIEGSLLRSDEYAIGTTIGHCQVFAKGKGIEFEYEIAGIKYKNCNTYHPIPIEDIIVPNGKYYVRYSEKYPKRGRINFQNPVK